MTPKLNKRAPGVKKFKPEPYSFGPHANEVHDIGGKLIGVPMPRRSDFDADLAAHAPGCGCQVDVVDGLPAEGVRCGGGDFNGKPVFCPHCQPVSEAAEIVRKMLA